MERFWWLRRTVTNEFRSRRSTPWCSWGVDRSPRRRWRPVFGAVCASRHCGREVQYASSSVNPRAATSTFEWLYIVPPTMSGSPCAAKLQNSRKVVARWARDAKDAELADQMASRSHDILARVGRLPRAPTPNHVRGVEGDAARIYFGAVRQALSKCELQFSGRRRRPPRDPVNAMLGFCYGLMLTEYIGSIEAVGMDYQMGFFHRPRSGRPSLALDLAEELRPLTDRFVVSLIRRRQVGSDSFVEMPGGAVYLSDEGRKDLIKEWERHKESELQHTVLERHVGRWALPSVQATLLARHLRGDLPAYPPFVMA